MKIIEYKNILLVLLSFSIVAFGQPAWIWELTFLSSSLGFALFWWVSANWEGSKKKFFFSFLWYACVQFIHLSWMTATEYHGAYIYLLLPLLSAGIALQFGMLTLLLHSQRPLSLGRSVFLSSFWVLMEWSRLFFLTGFPWNPVGLSLTGNIYSLQIASFFGVYGMSFWVVISNLFFFRVMNNPRNKKNILLCLAVLVAPYLFGFLQFSYQEKEFERSEEALLKVALLHTVTTPEERFDISSNMPHVQAYSQWKKTLLHFKGLKEKEVDLLVLPESLIPFGASHCFYPEIVVREAFEEVFGKRVLQKFPPLLDFFSMQIRKEEGGEMWVVNNAYWAQALSNIIHSDLVIGLDDEELSKEGVLKVHNAAFHFKPFHYEKRKYAKRILIPGSEYIPFSWMASIAENYGISGSFDSGEQAKRFETSTGIPFGVAICSEEIYGDVQRENRTIGAKFLVSLHNDIWFPNSRLGQQHFDHGIIRTVENGFPLLRSTNAGVTAAVDSLGRLLSVYEEVSCPGVLKASLPLYSYATLYSHLGDRPIIAIFSIYILFFCSFSFLKNRKLG